MSPLLVTMKVAAIACLALALLLVGHALASSADTPLHRGYRRYVDDLERRMRVMFIHTPVSAVVAGQAAAALAVLCLALFARTALWLPLLLPVAVAPRLVLERKRKQRVLAVEQKLEGFLVALGNALKASPNAGKALAMVQPFTAAPLDVELAQVLHELKLGSTLEQALGNLTARVPSFQLDAALSCLLIGKKTGGNVTHILHEVARTLREIARLQGLLRRKTAEGRAQINVLAGFPLVLIVGFEALRPGHFEPLLASATGVMVMMVALAMWVASIVMMRRIMAVQL